MTNEEYNDRMNSLIDSLPERHAELLVQVANTANAIMKNRIQETGTNAQGGKFKDYSSWYKNYKEQKGKYKGFTDFSFTNRMWNNIQLIKEETNEEIAVITARDKGQKGGNISVPVKASKKGKRPVKAHERSIYVPSNYEKLEKNTQKFGEILNLSKEEINELKKEYDSGILEIFRDHGL